MNEKVEKPWFETTSRDYDIFGPDKDGEICVEFNGETERCYLTKADVEKMLERFS